MWESDRRSAGQDCVVLKGSRDGVAIVIDETVSIEAAVKELRAKLVNAGNFFRGAVFRLDAGSRHLTPDDRKAISSTMEEFGISLLDADSPLSVQTPVRERSPVERQFTSDVLSRSVARESEGEPTLLVRRTLRSGQRIDADSHVVIMGDVNAGAVVTSPGDIIVLGSLRGLAHAGADGNSEAIVMAFRLEPTQLRIAQYISRAPDEEGPKPGSPEVARVRNETIQIEAYVP